MSPRRTALFVALAAALGLAGCGDPKVEWRGLNLVRPPLRKAGSKDVDKLLASLRDQMGTPSPLPASTPLARGHRAIIDFVGTIGGSPFTGGTAAAYALVLGEGSMIPGFEEGVIGMKAGETRTVPVTFPKDYQEPTLAGKKASFKVTVRSGEILTRPALDDAFAKRVSGGRITSLGDLRKAALMQVQQNLSQQAENSLRQQALDQLLARWKKTPSSREIDAELDRVVQGQLQNLAQQGRGPAQGGPDADSLRASLKPGVVRAVTVSHLLGSIAKHENVTVTEPDVEQAAAQMAQQQGQDPQTFMAYLKEHKLLDMLRKRILEDRAIALVLQQAVILDPGAPAPGGRSLSQPVSIPGGSSAVPPAR